MTYKFHVPVKPYFRLHPDFKLPTNQARAAQASWAVPALCSRYKWPANLAGGGVIAVVELGGGWLTADMTKFFASIGQPVPKITDVSVDGTKNVPGNDADYEVALDIQVAAAAYYAATGKTAVVRVYWAQDIAPAVRKAAADGCDVCSISWGADEATWGTAAGLDMEAAATAATTTGMVVFAASGDNDSSDGGPNPANVDLPAGCPHVVGCGGTSLTQSTETVWNNNPGQSSGEGTGGGYSTLFPAQAWQAGVPPAPAGLGRMIPDVASVADPQTGINIVVRGVQLVIGGTSAAAPLWSGLVAACGMKLGFITPKFYTAAADFTDITSGDNGVYKASKGPDPCTGSGSPLGSAIASLLAGTVQPPAPLPVPPKPPAPPAPPSKPPAPPAPPPKPPPPPDHHHHHRGGGRDEDKGGSRRR
jgi:kumamolisin